MTVERQWDGDIPFYLIVNTEVPPGNVVVDLDTSGWLVTLKEYLEVPGEWHLVRKKNQQVVLSLRVNEGDQPYYTARHIANTGFAGEVIAYGIGKKTQRFRKKKQQWVENEDNLWVLPWGQTCGGTDVEYFALKGLRSGSLPGV